MSAVEAVNAKGYKIHQPMPVEVTDNRDIRFTVTGAGLMAA